jgi:hypothetical protein
VIPQRLPNSWSYFVVVFGISANATGRKREAYHKVCQKVDILDVPSLYIVINLCFIFVKSVRWCLAATTLQYSSRLSRLA